MAKKTKLISEKFKSRFREQLENALNKTDGTPMVIAIYEGGLLSTICRNITAKEIRIITEEIEKSLIEGK
jgi:hypothetical protein